MQLILNSDTDTDIQRKMSAIEQESFNEKFVNSSLQKKIDSEYCDISKDSVKESVEEFLDENEDGEPNDISDISEDDKNISNETINDIISIDQTENNEDSIFPIVCDHENSNKASDVVPEEKETEKMKSNTSVEMEQNEEKQTDLQSREDKELNEEQQAHRETQENVNNQKKAEQESEEKHNHAEELDSEGQQESDERQEIKEKLESEQNKEVLTNTDLQDNIRELDTSMQESNNDKALTQITITDTESDKSKEISTDSIGNENIEIRDEKENENVTINDQEMTDVEKQSEKLSNIESDNIMENKESFEKGDNSCEKTIESDNIMKNKESFEEGDHSCEKTISIPKESSLCCNEDIPKNIEKCLENEQSKKEPVENKLTNTKESKKLSLICKLSNTLDILSDEEEEPVQKESLKEASSVEKNFINLEDDDDIMLVDEETDAKDNQNTAETKVEDKECQDSPSNSTNIDIIEEKGTF